MKKQTIKLIPGAHHIYINSANDIQTVIHYQAPPWKDRTCTEVVQGHWEIDSISKHLVTLANYDEVIPDKHNILKAE